MSQTERNFKVTKLVEKHKVTEKDVSQMTDGQVEYYYWLYFVDSVYDYM